MSNDKVEKDYFKKEDKKPYEIATRSGARVKDVKVCPKSGCKGGKMSDGSTCPLCCGEGLISNPNPTYT